MKLSPRTITILKNMSLIQNSILFRPGNVLSTMSPFLAVIARIEIAETIEREFGIYDLMRFLSVYSLLGEDAEITFHDTHLMMSNGTSAVRYVYAAPTTIKAGPASDPIVPSVDVQFQMTEESMSKITRALAVLSLPNVAVVGHGGVLSFSVFDAAKPNGDSFSLTLGETDSTFRVLFQPEHLRLLPMSYMVSISKRGIALFQGEGTKYWLAIGSGSTF